MHYMHYAKKNNMLNIVLLLCLNFVTSTNEKGPIISKSEPHALLLPDSSHIKFEIQEEALSLLSSIETNVAIIVVIGPYRSGKSFLLNQMLDLSCKEGFGVGHKREAQTKGVWMWGDPLVVNYHGKPLSLIFLDTEGLENAKMADVYDDRIFAFAALTGSLLIYNLPETVKEADIEKLSFAVEIAEEFFDRSTAEDSLGNRPSYRKRRGTFQMPHLLWLVQRDFLQGKTVKEMVDEALSIVPNPTNDKHINKVNSIRQSLSLVAKKYSAFGLSQPHLERTQLCELDDSELNPKYLKQRTELQKMVWKLALPKMVGDKFLNGQEFADFFKKMVNALNEREIPSAKSITEIFNKDVVTLCVNEYRADVEAVPLPKENSELEYLHRTFLGKAINHFEQKRFGRDADISELEAQINTIYKYRKDTNMRISMTICEELYLRCEHALEKLNHMKLPSVHKYNTEFTACNHTYTTKCMGPAKEKYIIRLKKLYEREKIRFMSDFNQKILNGLTMFSLALVIVGRFVLQIAIMEFVGWIIFIFLEIYPKIFFFNNNMFEQVWWKDTLIVYEKIVYNTFYDLNDWTFETLTILVLLTIFGRCICCMRNHKYCCFRERKKKKKPEDMA